MVRRHDRKIYLQAQIGTGRDIVRESRHLQTEEFEMVRKNVDQIELLTQAVVSLLRESQEVRLQGNVRSVRIASDFINMLVQSVETLSPPAAQSYQHVSKPRDCPYANDDVGQSSSSQCSIENPRNLSLDGDHNQIDILLPRDNEVTTENSKSDGKDPCGVDSGTCLLERGCSPSCSPLSDDQLFIGAKPCEFKDTTDSGNSSRSSSPNTSDQELTVDEVLSNSDYTSRVERAVKLGYSYQQLVMALRKLGKNADENQLLSEMIRMGSTVTRSSDTSPLDFPGDTVDDVCLTDLKADVNSSVYVDESDNLREIVIDGSNVAMSHGKDVFSCRGIKIAVDWFRQRGHRNITVFVPQWRKESSRPDAPIQDQEILTQLEQERCLSFTPARRVGGRRVVCYDDRYILQLASEVDGIVVSNDNYRDLLNEKLDFKKVIEERLLMYSFAGDRFMPPEDPLGRHGPSLNNFLCKKPTQPEVQPPECPYGKKCTYGNKCRFFHPERRNMPHKSVTEKLQEQAKQKMEERASKIKEAQMDKKQLKSDSAKKVPVKKTPLSRTRAIVPPDMTLKLHSGGEVDDGCDEEKKQEKKVTDDYNEKLNEHRRKLEKALAQTRKDCDVSSEVGRPGDQLIMRNVPSPNGIISPPSKSQNCFPQGIPTSGFSSPSSQLKVPTGTRSEELVSGHLLLAKKLSDESVDSKFFRERGTPDPNVQSSPISLLQMQESGVIDLSQNLDRQMSLQSKNQGYFQGNVTNQDEVDSMFASQQQYYSGPGAVPPQLMQQDPMSYISGPVDQCQSFPLTGREMLAHQVQRRQSACMEHHPVLTHVPSAPDGRRMSQSSSKRLMAPIERQNSSSDPQIHLTGHDLDYVRHTNTGLSPYQTFERKTYSQPTIRNHLSRSTSMQPQSVGNIGTIGRQTSEIYYPRQQVQCDYELMSPEVASNNQAFGTEGLYHSPANWKEAYSPSSSRHHQRLAHQQQQQQLQQQQQQLQMQQQQLQMQQQERFLQQQTLASHLQNQSLLSTLPQAHSYQHIRSQQQLSAEQQSPHYHHQQQQQQHVLSPHQQPHMSPLFQPNVLSMQSQQQEFSPPRHQQQVTSPRTVVSPLPMLSPESPSQQQMPANQSLAPDAAIQPTDPRYSMYYNLCGLFPEHKVRQVMNEHPQEMDPQEICAYIIGAK
ncbi:uncharacterized protein LOC121370440 isoform X2 [Gigantopelta aegis]|uniref:uncharacterized protein LOC121370440 isoform X2 n=1 Tax=Gigantopelta aegis TaxID=1735272 RepID=UPI001B88C91F|nr:uncharacterized protein LOC121370440 isoform X2 [Gigantopelta aegis]